MFVENNIKPVIIYMANEDIIRKRTGRKFFSGIWDMRQITNSSIILSGNWNTSHCVINVIIIMILMYRKCTECR